MTDADNVARLGELMADLALPERAYRRADASPSPADPDTGASQTVDLSAYTDLRWEASVPKRYREADLDLVVGAPRDLAVEWLATGADRNVLLLGPVGTGKTFAACAMARQVTRQQRTVEFWPVVELFEAMRPGREQVAGDAMAAAIGADVLILDDLGTERPSDWTFQQLYLIVNRRWLEQRPTLVTSNLAPDVLEEAVGSQTWSRLYHDALRLKLAGVDRRRAEAS